MADTENIVDAENTEDTENQESTNEEVKAKNEDTKPGLLAVGTPDVFGLYNSRRDSSEETSGFWETTKAHLNRLTPISAKRIWASRDPDEIANDLYINDFISWEECKKMNALDPNFDPRSTMEERGIDPKYFSVFKNAKNSMQFSALARQFEDDLESERVIANASLTTSLISGLTAGVVDPVNWLSVAGLWKKVPFAITAAIDTTLVTGLDETLKGTYREGEVDTKKVATEAVFNGAAIGLAAGLGTAVVSADTVKKLGQSLKNMTETTGSKFKKIGDNIYEISEKVGGKITSTPIIGPLATAVGQAGSSLKEGISKSGKWALEKLFKDTPLERLKNSTIEGIRDLAYPLFSEGNAFKEGYTQSLQNKLDNFVTLTKRLMADSLDSAKKLNMSQEEFEYKVIESISTGRKTGIELIDNTADRVTTGLEKYLQDIQEDFNFQKLSKDEIKAIEESGETETLRDTTRFKEEALKTEAPVVTEELGGRSLDDIANMSEEEFRKLPHDTAKGHIARTYADIKDLSEQQIKELREYLAKALALKEKWKFFSKRDAALQKVKEKRENMAKFFKDKYGEQFLKEHPEVVEKYEAELVKEELKIKSKKQRKMSSKKMNTIIDKTVADMFTGGVHAGQKGRAAIPGSSSFTKRTVNISDDVLMRLGILKPDLQSHLLQIKQMWITSKFNEMARNVSGDKVKTWKEYLELLEKEGTLKAGADIARGKEIAESYRDGVSLLMDIENIFRGNFSKDPALFKYNGVLKAYSYLKPVIYCSLATSQALSNLTDFGVLMLRTDAGNVFNVLRNRIHGDETIKRMRASVARFTGNDKETWSCLRYIGDEAARKITEANWLKQYSKLTLNEATDLFVRDVASSALLNDGLKEVLKGEKASARILRTFGINSPEEQRQIAELYRKVGYSKNGVHYLEAGKFFSKGDEKISEQFFSALRAQINDALLYPSIANTPIWIRTPIGSFFYMFKTYAYTAYYVAQRDILNGEIMQSRYASAILTTLALSYARNELSDFFNGRTTDYSTADGIKRVVDYSVLGNVLLDLASEVYEAFDDSSRSVGQSLSASIARTDFVFHKLADCIFGRKSVPDTIAKLQSVFPWWSRPGLRWVLGD